MHVNILLGLPEASQSWGNHVVFRVELQSQGWRRLILLAVREVRVVHMQEKGKSKRTPEDRLRPKPQNHKWHGNPQPCQATIQVGLKGKSVAVRLRIVRDIYVEKCQKSDQHRRSDEAATGMRKLSSVHAEFD